MTTPAVLGDATDDLVLPRTDQEDPSATATPDEIGDANIGTVSRVELLIENARMTARLDSQNELIGELRDDKTFLREQITHQRGNDTLMADMHRETLQTLRAVSVAGRHTRIEMPEHAASGEQSGAFYDVDASEQRPTDIGQSDV